MAGHNRSNVFEKLRYQPCSLTSCQQLLNLTLKFYETLSVPVSPYNPKALDVKTEKVLFTRL
jgi:hypothetical protein